MVNKLVPGKHDGSCHAKRNETENRLPILAQPHSDALRIASRSVASVFRPLCPLC